MHYSKRNYVVANGVIKTIALCVIACAIAGLARAADNPQMGTWKLNEAKSKFAAGSSKNTSVVYEADGDKVKVTVDGVDGEGKATHNTWTGKFDGKDYPVEGDPTFDTRAYKKVNDHTLAMTLKKGGKINGSGTVKVSADGKSRTVTTDYTGAKGKKMKSTAVYDKA
jgi:hypothetical protein